MTNSSTAMRDDLATRFTDPTEKANFLRFQILTALGQGGADLLREFEIALNEQAAARVAADEFSYQFTDKRAVEIANAERLVTALTSHIQGASAADLPQIHASLVDALTAKEAAYAMPGHQYNCLTCVGEDGNFEEFQSPARRILLVVGDVDHDEEGNVVRAIRFRNPLPVVLCPNCKGDIRIDEYTGRHKETKSTFVRPELIRE